MGVSKREREQYFGIEASQRHGLQLFGVPYIELSLDCVEDKNSRSMPYDIRSE